MASVIQQTTNSIWGRILLLEAKLKALLKSNQLNKITVKDDRMATFSITVIDANDKVRVYIGSTTS
jgi:hypothetical protein